MTITGKVRMSLSGYYNGKRISDMTEEERREIVEHFKQKGATEVEFY